MALPKTDSNSSTINCYFCNELFDEKYLQGHLMQCGSVLDPCPKKCGVYVLRMNKNKHLAECTARPRPTRPQSTYETIQSDAFRRSPIASPEGTIQRRADVEMGSLRLALELEKKSKREIQAEMSRFQNQHLKQIEHNDRVDFALETLQRTIHEEIENRKSSLKTSKAQLDQIYSHYRALERWKTGIECDLQQIKYQLRENSNKISDLRYGFKDRDNHLKSMEQIKRNTDSLGAKIEEERIKWHLEFMSFAEQFEKFRQFFQEENTIIASLWTDQNNEMQCLKATLEAHAAALDDSKANYHALKFDTKGIQQVAADASDKIESHGKLVQELRKALAQLEVDKEAAKQQSSTTTAPADYGYLLWRVDKIQEKIENAKQNDVVFHSPVFYSRRYGYKLRIFLNGIGKWKGRHIISSLQVIKSEWDPLLEWPCNIEAKVSIKDLTKTQPKDYTKSLTAKRQNSNDENEDPHETSTEYIFFVKNEIIDKEKYVKDNCMFIEIKITNDTVAET